MKKLALILSISVALISCKNETKQKEIAKVNAEATSNDEANEEWIYLFDGTTTEGWRAYNGDDLPPQWVIEDGVLTFDTEKRTEENRKGGKDIIYAAQEFDNFELAWEWKIPEGGNSGLLYHIQEGDWGIPEISPEYQMLDDLKWEEINNAKLKEWQKTGADYAMHLPDISQKIVKPAGEWNTSRIIFTPENVEHWLNGKKLLSFVPWSEDWEERKSKGKWKDSPKYGFFKKGYIGFQDHDSPIWLKNVKIKQL
ncbi:3-keto-disaccharide hydrolase [Zobellia barbeyronii]|uniref:DUF1080 domain-containing protein n=1 Tax=Zobellia barbeyronii TaxID=2748009 RepID=A0ABS5WG25_9FLAO|nr:DUF1080 domain-containing protein [Zobellia barbeyronii]MBT2162336.1 DUF1080 domain-containing protein [Zobellia barbeyronii]